ncbi:MAG: hypothetical protein HKP09_01295 [Enterobacterales bacterium]|nr:hypothetical protein [Enterobacterales bacterium]
MSEELINAILYSGIPIFLVTLVLSYWAASQGLDDTEEQSDATKNLSTADEETKPETSKAEHIVPKNKAGNVLHEKWVQFGGGYYGVMALCTYLHIELLEISQALADFESVQDFIQSVNVDFFVNLFISAIMNMIAAFMWWSHWPKILPIVQPVIWLVCTYAAYVSATSIVRSYFKYR